MSSEDNNHQDFSWENLIPPPEPEVVFDYTDYANSIEPIITVYLPQNKQARLNLWSKMTPAERNLWIGKNIYSMFVRKIEANDSDIHGQVRDYDRYILELPGHYCVVKSTDVTECERKSEEEAWADCPKYSETVQDCMDLILSLRKSWKVGSFNQELDRHDINTLNITVDKEKWFASIHKTTIWCNRDWYDEGNYFGAFAYADTMPEAVCMALFLFPQKIDIVPEIAQEVADAR